MKTNIRVSGRSRILTSQIREQLHSLIDSGRGRGHSVTE